MNYLCSLNLQRNELQNAVIQPLAVAPANPKEGQIYYNSTDKFIYRYDGTNWGPIGVVYSQGSTTGAVITGLSDTGTVTTTNVVGLTLTGYTPVDDGYVSNNMTLQQAIAALDTAVKNAVAGGGEVNQNAWSNITVKKQSTALTAVAGQAADGTLSATAKTDTFTIASGNKWVDINGTSKTINVGHALSGVTAGSAGSATAVPTVTVDAAGHVTGLTSNAITPAGIGAVASVGATANGGLEVAGTDTDPTVGIKLDPTAGNAATLSAAGLMVTIPEVDVPEYTITKLATATSGYLASYQLQKGGTGIGEVINIPKDYLVKDAEIKTSTGTSDPSGFPAGTKYIDFTINTYDTSSGSGTTSHIYLNVEDLVDVYTAGNGINISAANVVSAKVVASNGLSLDADGIKLGVASTSANGAMTSAMVTKLNGIATGATNNTITLNGSAVQNPSFYAPTTAGTKDQILMSSGTGAPVWADMSESFHKYSATNPALDASGGAFAWTIYVTDHLIQSPALLVQVFEASTGAQVITDVTVDPASYAVTITINDTGAVGKLTANTYRVVIFG